jgi:hypothetical protein
MMWSITTCRTLYVNVAPNYRSEGRACQVRVLEGPACRVRATLDYPLRFGGHDRHAPPNCQSDKTGARRSSSPLADRIKGVN